MTFGVVPTLVFGLPVALIGAGSPSFIAEAGAGVNIAPAHHIKLIRAYKSLLIIQAY